MKTWHQHVAASQHRAMDGGESEGMRVLVDRLMEEQTLSEKERAELAADAESRRMIFWNGYERMSFRHDSRGGADIT